MEGITIDEEKISRIVEMLKKIEGNKEKEAALKSFIKNNVKKDSAQRADLLELMLENLTKVQNESNNNNDNFNEDEIDQNEIPELSEVIEENSKDNKTNANSQETLGSLVEKFQMLGYEIKFRRDKAIAYYQEHLEEIKNGSKKQLKKYASKLARVKELETEYSILKNKIEARRKFESKIIDQSLNEKYEKRDSIMGDYLTNIEILEHELEALKEKATNYYEEHSEEIKNGSKKHIQKYAEKLSKVRKLQYEYEIAKTGYKALRKDKENSYSMFFGK